MTSVLSAKICYLLSADGMGLGGGWWLGRGKSDVWGEIVISTLSVDV